MRARLLLLALLPLLAFVGTVPAHAAPGSGMLKVTVVKTPEQPSTANYVTVGVTITDAGRPPAETFVVFGQASNSLGEQTDPSPCTSRVFQDPQAPEGVFDCTVIVDHGGRWLFEGLVNRVSAQGKAVEVARGGVTLDITAGTLLSAGKPPPKNIVAKGSDVLALLVHLTATTGWILSVCALLLLSVPWCRRMVSRAALHWLEVNRSRLVVSLWTSTALTIATGVLLLSRQTAYATPSSVNELRAVNQLPYGKPYFTALGVKLAVFAVMVLASTVLARQSGRLALATDLSRGGTPQHPSPWSRPADRPPVTVEDPRGPATVGTLERAAAPEATPPEPTRGPLVSVAALVLAGGLVALEVCIVLLKYYHELVEATRNLGGG